MRWFLAGPMFLAVTALGQTPAPRPKPLEVFQQARARLLADAARMPNYSCEQNIIRHFYRSASEETQSCAEILARREKRKHEPAATSWDRLQLDVTVADQGEIHSWPGAAKFDEDEIRRLVNNGPFGSGDFSAFVSGIFGGSATIKFAGQRTVAGRSLFEYSFAVSGKASRYRVASADGELITAYAGSFLLDPQTGDLFQLAVRTAELPEATSACQAISEIEYRRQDIHDRQVLIPKQTDLRMVYRDGREAVASTSYSSCHEYTSKSVLHFDNADLGTAKPSTKPVSYSAPPSPLPAGLKFNCRVVTPINSDTAAGRLIEAILRSPIRGKDKNILVPAGARIHGRLVRLAEHLRPLDYFEVGIRFESIEMNGAERPLYASRAELAALPFGPAEWGGVDGKAQLAELPARAPRSVGIFFFVREHLHLAQFDSQWITTPPESPMAAHPTPAQKPAVMTQKLPAPATNQAADAVKPTPEPTSSAEAEKQKSQAAAQDLPVPDVQSMPAMGEIPTASTTTAASPMPPRPTTSTPMSSAPAASLPSKIQASTPAPAGAAISAELSKSVDARKNKVGDKVEARITQQSILPGKVVLPRDTKIMGHVSKVKANSKDSPGSMVEITFDEALLKGSQQLPLQMTLQAIGKPIPIEAAQLDSSLTQAGAAPAAAPSGNSHNTANEVPREAPPSTNPDADANIQGEDGPRSTLNDKSEGVVGFDGLALSASAQASTISSAKGNVHLDKGTQLILRTL